MEEGKGKGKWERGKGRGRSRGRRRGREREGGRKIAYEMLDGRTDARTHGHKGDFILCPMLLCIALDR